jgi:hypothetical protein
MRYRPRPLLIIRRRSPAVELRQIAPIRFSLRTLMIVISMACTAFSWPAYLRRVAGHHRDELTRLVSKISETDALQRQDVDEAIQWLAAGTAKAMLVYDPKLGKTFVCYRGPTGGLGRPFFRPDSADWHRAVYHKKMAETYDASLLRPWRLLSTPDHP